MMTNHKTQPLKWATADSQKAQGCHDQHRGQLITNATLSNHLVLAIRFVASIRSVSATNYSRQRSSSPGSYEPNVLTQPEPDTTPTLRPDRVYGRDRTSRNPLQT